MKRAIAGSLIAAALVLGFNVQPASAVVSPVSAAVEAPTLVESARWVCGPYRCYWQPNYVGPFPFYPWATGWGPPRHSRCYYAKRPSGRWVLVC